jgi:DNA-binding response OmpR family regulator
MKSNEHSSHSSQQHTPCVVVVDDNEQLRRMLVLALETADFDVRQASSEIELHRILTCVVPDALLIDLQRSEDAGLQLLQRLRSRTSLDAVPIAFLAGTDDEEFRRHTLRAGADWFGVRPLGMLELQQCLAELVTGSSRSTTGARHKRVS